MLYCSSECVCFCVSLSVFFFLLARAPFSCQYRIKRHQHETHHSFGWFSLILNTIPFECSTCSVKSHSSAPPGTSLAQRAWKKRVNPLKPCLNNNNQISISEGRFALARNATSPGAARLALHAPGGDRGMLGGGDGEARSLPERSEVDQPWVKFPAPRVSTKRGALVFAKITPETHLT